MHVLFLLVFHFVMNCRVNKVCSFFGLIKYLQFKKYTNFQYVSKAHTRQVDRADKNNDTQQM